MDEVYQKWDTSRNYRQSQDLETKWDRWTDYYEGTSEAKEDREDEERSALLPPWASAVVDQLHARYILTFFEKQPYYDVVPLNKNAIKSNQISSKLLLFQEEQPSFYDQVDRFIHRFVALGFGTLKTGWDFTGEGNFTVTVWRNKNFYHAPYCEDITKLGYGIFESWRPLDELKKENEEFGKKHKDSKGKPVNLYDHLDELEGGAVDLDSEDSGKHTAAEKQNLIHLLEFWDDERKILVGNKMACLLATVNVLGFIPAICCSDMIKLSGVEGTGEIEGIEDYIEQIATIVNQRNDNILLALNPVWFRNVNIDILNDKDLRNLKPGMMINVDAQTNLDMRGLLYPFEVPFITGASYNEVGQIEKWIMDKSGMQDAVRGMRGEGRETATGIARLQAAGGILFRAKILFALRTAFTLLPSQQIAWNQEFATNKYIELVTGEKDEEAIKAFRKRDRDTLQADFKCRERISAIDPEADKQFMRSQIIEAMRVIFQGMQMMQSLPPDQQERMMNLQRAMLDTFDRPELAEAIGKEKPPTTPEQLMRRLGVGGNGGVGGGAAPPGMSPGMAQGRPMPGARAATPAGAMPGRQAGGRMGQAMGQLGGR